MLFNFSYAPDDEDIAYHYCSVEAAEAILRTGTIRFSDINLLNDAAEMRWGYSIFEEAATRLLQNPYNVLKPVVDRSFLDLVDSFYSGTEFHSHLLSASFSKHSDDLSQWRAYAADGEGVAIGFCAKRISKMPSQAFVCNYEPEEQIEAVCAHLTAMALMARTYPPADMFREIRKDCLWLAALTPSLKHPSFKAEGEIRCVRMLNVRIDPDAGIYSLDDPGGSDEGGDAPTYPINFRVAKGTIIPYQDIEFARVSKSTSVKEVVLGPRCPNASGNILAMTAAYGYKGITVRNSESSYRG